VQWTETMDGRLRALWKDHSASQISAEMARDGWYVSRNAVIGRGHRLKLTKNNKTVISLGTRHDILPRVRVDNVPVGSTAYKVIHAIKRGQQQPKPRAEPFFCKDVSGVEPIQLDILDLEPGNCRWPYGDHPVTFCGHPQVPSSSYCAAHTRVSSGAGSFGERQAHRVSRKVA